MIRVAFRFIDSKGWQGGYNYLLNLCRSLVEHQSDSIQPIMFHGDDLPETDLLPFREPLGENLIQATAMGSRQLKSRLPRSLLFGCDRVTEKILQQHGIDVVFENADFYGRNFDVPVISWTPDFQHRRMPYMYTYKEYWRREIGFQSQFRAGRQIMVSSEDAKADALRYYRAPESRVHVVRFAVPYVGEPNAEERQQAIKKYQLPDKFFFLPNQFWNHKNHELVIDALALLIDQHANITVAVSGGALHSRNVAVLKAVEAKVADAGMADRFRLLGRIPFADLVSLLTGSIALLNPSRFEGWSTTIEEAKAFGVKMVLSRLPVHLEQVGDDAIFFDTDDAQSLADSLVQAQTQFCEPRPTVEVLQKNSTQRMSAFAQRFSDLARLVVETAK